MTKHANNGKSDSDNPLEAIMAGPTLEPEVLDQINRDRFRRPFPHLAKRHGLTPVQLAYQLRRAKLSMDIMPAEVQLINEVIDEYSHDEIRVAMGLTESQFEQIRWKKLHRPPDRPTVAKLTEVQVIEQTQRLVNDTLPTLRKPIHLDDALPRQITSGHFKENDLAGLVTYAESKKKKDSEFKHWPAVAYLIGKAFPGVFKGWQFRHAKTCKYFDGPQGRSNLLQAVRWIATEKLETDPDQIEIVEGSPYFLRTTDLAFYGISQEVVLRHFGTTKELVAAAMKPFRNGNNTTPAMNTRQLREILADSVDGTRCAVPTCGVADPAMIEVHHIFPRRDQLACPIPIDAPANLMPLCRNHHALANRIDHGPLLKRDPAQWRSYVIERLFEREAGDCQAAS